MHHPYYDTISLIERLHRYFLEAIKVELDRAGIDDINNVQALILYNIGDDELTVGELTERGYYLGSNVSYNVKKMVENAYITQHRAIHDKRSVKVKLSEKAVHLRARLQQVLQKHVQGLSSAQIPEAELSKVNETLKRLEKYWGGLVFASY